MKIPKEMYSLLGPLPVTIEEEIPHENPAVVTMGNFSPMRRVIEASRAAPVSMFATVMHEWMHSGLYDTGVSNMLTRDQEESVCDALSLLLTGAVQQGYMTLHVPR